MLNCKQVAISASDYLDKNLDGKLHWQTQLHLMMCSQCRRFLRHLRITLIVAGQSAPPDATSVEVDMVLTQVKQRIAQRDQERR